MSGLTDNWFLDDIENIKIGLKVDNILYKRNSPFQEIIIFENSEYGRILALNGTIQLTERDECAYHEMIVHLTLNSHHNPKKVLIIGGGDGGVAREVVKDPRVQSVDLCEIDQEILDISREFLPFTACGLDHPKVTIHVRDGAEFVNNNINKYDVVITDSSDLEEDTPMSAVLFQRKYYEAVKRAMAPGGILCSQAMGMWVDEAKLKGVYKACSSVFQSVAYASTSVPSFLGGSNGFILCSSSSNKIFREPVVVLTEEEMDDYKLKIYTPELHTAAFAIPRRFQKILQIEPKTSHKSPQVDHGSK